MEAGADCGHVHDCSGLWRPHRDRVHPGPQEEDLPLLPVCTHRRPKHRTGRGVSLII